MVGTASRRAVLTVLDHVRAVSTVMDGASRAALLAIENPSASRVRKDQATGGEFKYGNFRLSGKGIARTFEKSFDSLRKKVIIFNL